jgi:hypothetical protein
MGTAGLLRGSENGRACKERCNACCADYTYRPYKGEQQILLRTCSGSLLSQLKKSGLCSIVFSVRYRSYCLMFIKTALSGEEECTDCDSLPNERYLLLQVQRLLQLLCLDRALYSEGWQEFKLKQSLKLLH